MQAVRPPPPPLIQGFLFGREKGKGGGQKGEAKKEKFLLYCGFILEMLNSNFFIYVILGSPGWYGERAGLTCLLCHSELGL